jgi:hypothetical protein
MLLGYHSLEDTVHVLSKVKPSSKSFEIFNSLPSYWIGLVSETQYMPALLENIPPMKAVEILSQIKPPSRALEIFNSLDPDRIVEILGTGYMPVVTEE